MIGNVWEWTNSLFRLYPYDPNDGRESGRRRGFGYCAAPQWVNDANVTNCLSRLDGDFQFYNNVSFRCAVSGGVATAKLAQANANRGATIAVRPFIL